MKSIQAFSRIRWPAPFQRVGDLAFESTQTVTALPERSQSALDSGIPLLAGPLKASRQLSRLVGRSRGYRATLLRIESPRSAASDSPAASFKPGLSAIRSAAGGLRGGAPCPDCR